MIISWQTIAKAKNLAISVVPMRELNLATRIDAEHYQPHFIAVLDLVKRKEHKKLSEVVSKSVTTGHTPSMSDETFYGGDVKFIKTDNLRDNHIVEDFSHYLSDKGANKLKNALLREDDIIITIIGATYDVVGRVARIFSDLGRAAINQNISLVRPSIASGYLACFLMGKYGKQQLYYLSRQTEQVNLNNAEVADVLVPIANENFVNKIHALHNETHHLYLSSKKLYAEAERLLLKEINLEEYRINDELISIRNLSECLADNRFDAEYWQPKYEKLIAKMTKSKTLGQIAKIKRGSLINPSYYSDKGVPYIRGADFSKNELDDVGMVYVSSDFNRTREVVVDKGDIVFASIGSVGKTALVTEKYKKSYISNNIGKISLTDKTYIPQYVQICLQSILGQSQLERLQTQTAQPKISDADIAKILIPSISKEKQEEISELAEQAREMKRKSQYLLNKVKRAVEIFVEQSERQALQYLET